eukprot:4656853-Pyramimonas_sp.AAC.1
MSMLTGGRNRALTPRTCRISSTLTWHAWPQGCQVPARRGETRQEVRPRCGGTRQTAQPACQRRCT